jgi:hypothetical protein
VFYLLTMPTAKLIKRGGSSSDTSLVVELVALSSSGGIISHRQEVDNCNSLKDASISVASSQSKNKIQQRHKEKVVAKKSQLGVKPTIMKKKPKRCNHEGCTNQAITGGVCVSHGAKRYVYIHGGKVVKVTRKRCSFEGCTNQAQKGGVCITHGAKKKRKLCNHKC